MSLIKDAVNKSEDDQEKSESKNTQTPDPTGLSPGGSFLEGLSEPYRFATVLFASLVVFMFSVITGASIVFLFVKFWM